MKLTNWEDAKQTQHVKCMVCGRFSAVEDVPDDIQPGATEWLRCPHCGTSLKLTLEFHVVAAGA